MASEEGLVTSGLCVWHILYWCGADDPSSVNLNIGSGVLVTLVMFLGADDPGSITIWCGRMV